MRLICIVAALAVTCPGAAFAKGAVRAEAVIGWDQVSWDLKNFTIAPGRQNIKGATYGGNVGYDFPVGPGISVGIDGALTGTTANLDQDLYLRSFSIGRDFYAGARVTLRTTPSLHVYVKAGYSNARIRTNNGLLNLPQFGGHTGVLDDKVRDVGGVRAGVGVQYSLIGPIYASAEYSHTNYAEHISRNQFLTGVGVRF